MDVDLVSKLIEGQWVAVKTAPVPLLVSAIVLVFIVWRAMQWRYLGIIERLRDEVDHLRRHVVNANLNGALSAKAGESGAAVSPTSMTAARSSEEKDERIFLGDSVTPQFLAQKMKGLTSLQAEKAALVYVGKWIKVSGEIVNIAVPNAGKVGVSVTQPNDRFCEGAFMTFENDIGRLEVLHPGDQILALGRIDGIGPLGIQLSNCELIEK